MTQLKWFNSFSQLTVQPLRYQIQIDSACDCCVNKLPSRQDIVRETVGS